ncbi:H/ACA ribonucleoprotein complex subunit 1 [Enteropsectra breve]|nr:H/ACA ribonucleoprotein complex subunit 1 [Enteropsectra breve]
MAANYKFKKPQSTETVHLGTYLHPCEDMLVLKMEHRDIPYPNSPVLKDGKVVGKIEEVFGPVNDVFVAVKLEKGCELKDFKTESKFDAYKDKFIFKDRFLPREEVEKAKEQKDRKGKEGFNNKKGSFNNKRGSFSDGKRNNFGDNKRNNFGDNKRGNFGDNKRNNFGDNKRSNFSDNKRNNFGDNKKSNFGDNKRSSFNDNKKKDFRKNNQN